MEELEHLAGDRTPSGSVNEELEPLTGQSWLSSKPAKIGAGILGATAALPFLPEEAELLAGAGAMTVGSRAVSALREYLASKSENRQPEYDLNVPSLAREYGTNIAGMGVAKNVVGPFLSGAAPGMSNVARAGAIGSSAGATQGGFSGAMSDRRHPFVGAGKGMFEGALIGGPVGMAGQIIANKFVPRPPSAVSEHPFPSREELASATPQDQMKMNREQRSQSFKAQQASVISPFNQQEQERVSSGNAITGGVSSDVKRFQDIVQAERNKSLADLEAEKDVSKNVFENKKFSVAQKIQSDLPKVAAEQGKVYRALYDQGLSLSGGVRLSEPEVRSVFEKHYPNDPESVNSALKDIGFKLTEMPSETVSLGDLLKGSPQASKKSWNIPIERISLTQSSRGIPTPQENTIDIGKISDYVKSIRPQKSKMYSPDDVKADDLADALSAVIRRKAPPEAVEFFDRASAGWAKWKPIWKQAYQEYDPFVQQPTGLKPGMTTLEDVAKTPKDVETPNRVFINQLEKYMNMEPGGLSSELRDILSKTTAEQQRIIAGNLVRDQMIQDIRRSGQQGISSLKRGIASDIFNIREAKASALGAVQRNQSEVKSAMLDERKYGEKNNAIKRVLKRIAWFAGLRIGYKIMRGGR